jgi:large subunit ribosomal protein L25
LKKKVQASVQIEIIGAEDSPGVRFGGLVEQIIREANIECLPTEIPDSIIIDASQMEIGDSLHVSDLAVPEGAEMVDEGDIVIATMAASRLAAQVERDAEEAETELIGDGEAAEGEDGEAADSDEAASSDGDGDGE